MINKKLLFFLAAVIMLTISYLAGITSIQGEKYHDQHVVFKNENKCDANDSSFCTHLPLIIIDTNNQEIPGALKDGSTVLSEVKIIDNQENGNHLEDKPSINSKAKIRYRGDSSLSFDKKGYKINFVNDNAENKISVMGMEKNDEWTLHGPFVDKTLLRNYLWYHIYHFLSC